MCIRGPAYSRRHSETYLGTYLCLLRVQSARPSCLESQIGNGAISLTCTYPPECRDQRTWSEHSC